MPFKMSELKGIQEGQIAKLREVSIETTDDLLRVWGDGPKRPALVVRTGIAHDHFIQLVAMSRLARVNGVSLKHIDLLVAAGIDGPRRLHEYTPEMLVEHLSGAIAEKKLAGTAPTLADVEPWFTDRKPVAAAAK